MKIATRLERHDFLLSQPNAVLINAAVRDGHLVPPRKRGNNSTLVHLSEALISQKRREPHEFVRFIPIRRPPRDGDLVADAWLMIGRMADSDIMINDYTISKRHARLQHQPEKGTIKIEDLNSTNGTWHNNSRLEPHRYVSLKSHDNLRFGRYGFTFLNARHFYDFLIELSELK
jgi:hypothetical protein